MSLGRMLSRSLLRLPLRLPTDIDDTLRRSRRPCFQRVQVQGRKTTWPMIDREARNKLAAAIRHFVTGRHDNFEFDHSIWSIRTKDAGVVSIRKAMWHTYDDFTRHKLNHKWSLSDSDKERVFRFILFLKSDCEYRWPRSALDTPFIRLIIGALTLGLMPRYLDIKWRARGALEVWPFLTSEEFEEAKRNPAYLANAS